MLYNKQLLQTAEQTPQIIQHTHQDNGNEVAVLTNNTQDDETTQIYEALLSIYNFYEHTHPQKRPGYS